MLGTFPQWLVTHTAKNLLDFQAEAIYFSHHSTGLSYNFYKYFLPTYKLPNQEKCSSKPALAHSIHSSVGNAGGERRVDMGC